MDKLAIERYSQDKLMKYENKKDESQTHTE